MRGNGVGVMVTTGIGDTDTGIAEIVEDEIDVIDGDAEDVINSDGEDVDDGDAQVKLHPSVSIQIPAGEINPDLTVNGVPDPPGITFIELLRRSATNTSFVAVLTKTPVGALNPDPIEYGVPVPPGIILI